MRVTFCEECGCRYVVDHPPTVSVPECSTCRSHPGIETAFRKPPVYVSQKMEGAAAWDFEHLLEAPV